MSFADASVKLVPHERITPTLLRAIVSIDGGEGCLWFVKVSERVEDTRLSLALNGEMVDVTGIKPWHRVNT